MAGTDKVDTHGHTKDQAALEYPGMDVVDADAASQVSWSTGAHPANAMVLAQTATEVLAQINNAPAT